MLSLGKDSNDISPLATGVSLEPQRRVLLLLGEVHHGDATRVVVNVSRRLRIRNVSGHAFWQFCLDFAENEYAYE